MRAFLILHFCGAKVALQDQINYLWSFSGPFWHATTCLFAAFCYVQTSGGNCMNHHHMTWASGFFQVKIMGNPFLIDFLYCTEMLWHFIYTKLYVVKEHSYVIFDCVTPLAENLALWSHPGTSVKYVIISLSRHLSCLQGWVQYDHNLILVLYGWYKGDMSLSFVNWIILSENIGRLNMKVYFST